MERMNRSETNHARHTMSKAIFKALGIFGSIQMLSILCGVARVKLVAIWIGPAGVGLFSIYLSAMTLVSTLTQLGLRTSAVRDLASAAATGTRDLIIAVVRRWGWWLGGAGAVIMMAISPFMSLNTFADSSHTIFYMLLAPGVLLYSATASEQAIMQGLGHLRPLAISSTWGICVSLTVSVPILYLWRESAIIPVVVLYVIVGYLTLLPYRDRTPSPPGLTPRCIWQTGRPMLTLGMYMTISAILNELTGYIFLAWINTTAGTGETGIYQAAYTIINRYAGMLLTAIEVEFYPRLASVAAHPRRQETFVSHEILLVILILLPMVMFFIPLASILIRLLYSSEFLPGVPMLLLAAPGIVLRGFSWCMAFVILARGDGRTYIVTEALSCVTGLALNIICYRLWGITGLGLSFSIWYLIYTLITGYVYFHRYGMRMPRHVGALTAITVLMATAGAVTALCIAPWPVAIPAVPALIFSLYALYRMFRG